jgi:hypothetical protein
LPFFVLIYYFYIPFLLYHEIIMKLKNIFQFDVIGFMKILFLLGLSKCFFIRLRLLLFFSREAKLPCDSCTHIEKRGCNYGLLFFSNHYPLKRIQFNLWMPYYWIFCRDFYL